MFWIIALVVAVMLFKDKPWMKGIIDPIKNMFSKNNPTTPAAQPMAAGTVGNTNG